MTDAQKTQALLNAVIMEGNAMIKEAGGLTLDAAGQFEVFNANLVNSTDQLKRFAAQIGENVVTSLNGILELVGAGGVIDNALFQQSERLTNTSSTWEEYEAGVIQAAKAAGVIQDGFKGFIDDQGRLIQVLDTGRIQYHELASEVQFLGRETFKATKVQEDWTQAIGFDAPSAVSSYVDAAREGARASRELTMSTQDTVLSINDLKTIIAGPMREENERFAEEVFETQAELEGMAMEVEGLGASFDRVTGTITNMGSAFGENAEKAREIETAYQGVQRNSEELAEEHRQNINSIIFDLTMAELAAEGFSDAEKELLNRLAEDLGLADAATRTAMLGISDAMAEFAVSEGVETALFSLGQVRDTALGIPNDIPINIQARITQGQQLVESIMGGAIPSGVNIPGFQTGIDVVPRPMLAMLHQGEQVVPREDNPNLPGNDIGNGGGKREFHLHITQGAPVDMAQMRSDFDFLQMMEG
jgi:hypothetical protein